MSAGKPPGSPRPDVAEFVPQIFHRERQGAVRFREPTFSILCARAYVTSLQLATVAGAATIAKTAVAPLERIKILLQVDPISRACERGRAPLQTARACLSHVLSTGGWQALWRGNVANTLRVAPEVMLKFGIHDQLRVIFGGAADSTHMSLSGRLAAGSATGVLRTTLLHPLSVIRTRLAADTGGGAHAATPTRLYRGVWACVLSTWRRERLAGFYGGFSVAMVSTVPYLTICFTAYDSLKALLPSDKHSVHLWWYPLCKMSMAAGSAIAAQAITYPLDTVRRRLEVADARGFTQRSRSALHCLRSIINKEGGNALYRGCLVNAFKVVPSTAIQFIAYDSIKSGMLLLDPVTATAARI